MTDQARLTDEDRAELLDNMKRAVANEDAMLLGHEYIAILLDAVGEQAALAAPKGTAVAGVAGGGTASPGGTT